MKLVFIGHHTALEVLLPGWRATVPRMWDVMIRFKLT